MSSRRATVSALLLLSAAACQCMQPVEQCLWPNCAVDAGPTDGGRHDAGAVDGGSDGGPPDSGGPSWDGGGDCTLWDGGGVGECAATTGYVFDGLTCQGQCVVYPITTPGVYPTVAACAHLCALPYCHTDLLAAVLPQVLGPAAYCDDVQVATGLPWLVQLAFPELDAGCTLPTGVTQCTLLRSQTLGDAGYLEMCAATLLPETTRVTCFLYGP